MTFANPPLPPLLHVSFGATRPGGPTYSHWFLDPTVALLLGGMVAAYIVAAGPLNRRSPGWEERVVSRRQALCFAGAILTILVALGPPLDDWSDWYLLSAHMVEHLLLAVVAAPLLLLGLPAWMLRPLLRWRAVDRIGRFVTRPIPALLISGAALAVWHVPALYDAALRHQSIHVLEHGTFFLGALIGSWPIVGPLPEWPRPTPPLQCLYLFGQTIPSGLVGAIITLGSPGLYDFYASVPRIFGLDLQTDQQIAGLLMWVGMNTIFLLLITIVFFQWAASEEAKDRAPRPLGLEAPGSAPHAPLGG